MGKKKKVKAPVYKAFEGNEYTDRARQDLGGYGDWVRSNWENLTKPLGADDYTDIVNRAYQTTWNDYLDQYKREANTNAAQQYGRFGGLGSTPSLETQDQWTKQQNDLASRLGSQMYSMGDQLASNQMNRNLQSLATVQGLYDNAGNIITALDKGKVDTENKNIEAKYLADVQNANRGGWSWGNMAAGAISGATQGGMMGGPWGALAGGIAGAGLGGLSGYSDTSGKDASGMGSYFGSMLGQGITTWGNNRGGSATGWTPNLNQGYVGTPPRLGH